MSLFLASMVFLYKKYRGEHVMLSHAVVSHAILSKSIAWRYKNTALLVSAAFCFSLFTQSFAFCLFLIL
jgi:hypothetical protein